DLGIAAGRGKGMIFKRGEMLRTVSEAEMVDALLEEINKWEAEEMDKGRVGGEQEGLGRRRKTLPVLRT
ncbi:MAG TPA: 4-hydroxy-3-methylbut-2-en-1-yl diphosphate synthase, partial [Gemmatales bacterium]|nr:4-hydroxy-3-methylbut-2-en-1-yl diphosphate synthase [Gemmatales bacterium]